MGKKCLGREEVAPFQGQGHTRSYFFYSSLHLVTEIVTFSSYRGGVDSEGRPVMVVVGAHFLLRCLDLERFVLYVVKVIQLCT